MIPNSPGLVRNGDRSIPEPNEQMFCTGDNAYYRGGHEVST